MITYKKLSAKISASLSASIPSAALALILSQALNHTPYSWAEDNGIKQARELSSVFESVADRITPSVVNINAVRRVRSPQKGKGRTQDPLLDPLRERFGEDFFERFMPDQGEGAPNQPSLGTGVIIDDKGHILTNNHVIGDADQINVRLHDQRSFKAQVIGKDERSDLAVIKITAKGLTPATLGNSDDLKIGEWVVASGNPFGLDNTITAGIVSAKGRSIMGGNQYEDFIQTDAAINPGNSGGPLVNLEGEVVGINTAIFSRSGGYMGIGFAIPISMAKNIFQSLITSGKVVRGWLGVGIQNLTEDMAKSFNYEGSEGALVGHVQPDGPADKAGIKQGDIVIELDGVKIRTINQLRNYVASLIPGKTVDLKIVRDGKEKALKVTVDELPAQQEEQEEVADEAIDLGIAMEELTPELRRQLNSSSKQGAVVARVRPGSLAAEGGIMPRDIIVSINGEKVSGPDDVRRLITEAGLKKGLRVIVETDGMERFVMLRSVDE